MVKSFLLGVVSFAIFAIVASFKNGGTKFKFLRIKVAVSNPLYERVHRNVAQGTTMLTPSPFHPPRFRAATQISSTISSGFPEEPNKTSIKMQPSKIFKKIFPLGFMLFFILFNYTILRDTKDVLVITAPNSGAEIIPFLKTYVNLPASIGFTVAYNALVNKMSPDKAFYVVSYIKLCVFRVTYKRLA